MVYLIYGSQNISIKNKIKRIVKEKLGDDYDDMNYVRYDAANTLVQECVDDANSVPLGYDHKIVVMENCYFLLKTKGKDIKINSEEQDFEKLKTFILNKNDQCDLILTVISLNLNKSSDIYKLINENGNITEIPDLKEEEWTSEVRKYCLDKKHLNIDSDALLELAERTSGDLGLLQNSVTKLSLYKDHITKSDIEVMVARQLEDNVFLIFNYLLWGKNNLALALYRDLKATNIESVSLISALASQFRFLNQVKFLSSQGKSNFEIADMLSVQPFRVQKARQNANSISNGAINKTLDELFKLDNESKSGPTDRFSYNFELFLINFKRN